jgi:hypothetical protein
MSLSSSQLILFLPPQHLLLVHTPPHDIPERRHRDNDVEQEPVGTPDTPRRRQTISWFGEDVRHPGTRDSSVGRTLDRYGTGISPQGTFM